MLRSVFSQIGARMDAAAATRPSLAVAQAILAKTRKGLIEQGEDAARFHAEGFATLLAWIGTGFKRTPEETATLQERDVAGAGVGADAPEGRSGLAQAAGRQPVLDRTRGGELSWPSQRPSSTTWSGCA